MIHKVESYAKENKLFGGAKVVLAGLSGGADSVCLFLMLHKLSSVYGYRLEAVHVNHMIRGSEADRDEQFCAHLCKRYGVRLHVERVNVPLLAKERRISTEEAGRNARYEIFEKIARGIGDEGAVRIAVAHHMDDQAETVLFNMIRGSRYRGLEGMRARNGAVIRPLLCITRSQVEEYLRLQSQDYCTDSTNEECDYSRNLIRNRIVPELQSINSGAVKNIAAMAEGMGRLGGLVERLTDVAQKECVNLSDGRYRLELEPFGRLDPVIKEQLMYRLLCQCTGVKKDIGRVHVQSLVELAAQGTGKRLDLPYGVCAVNEYGYMYLACKSENTQRQRWRLMTFLTQKAADEYIESQKNNKNIYTIGINCDKIKGSLLIRTKQTGDVIAIGENGATKTIQRLFIDEKVPREQRDSVPIVFDGQEAVWAVGVRLSYKYRLTEDTDSVLYLVVEPDEVIIGEAYE